MDNWRLYLPEIWRQDFKRRQQAGVPEEAAFQTKPEIALERMRQAVAQKIPAGVLLADAGYGNGVPFRTAVTELGLQYVVGIQSSTTVWEPGQPPLPAPQNQGSAPPHGHNSKIRPCLPPKHLGPHRFKRP